MGLVFTSLVVDRNETGTMVRWRRRRVDTSGCAWVQIPASSDSCYNFLDLFRRHVDYDDLAARTGGVQGKSQALIGILSQSSSLGGAMRDS
jgi:hypothetical protein